MSFDLNVFAAVGNPETMQQAEAVIMEAESNPQFIQIVLGALEVPEVQANDFVFQQIQLSILRMIRDRRYWINDAWSPEEKGAIAAKLLQLIMTFPFDKRGNLVACYRSIILESFPNPQLMMAIMQLLQERSGSIQDVASILNLIYFWAKGVSDWDVRMAGEEDTTAENEFINTFNIDLMGKLAHIANCSMEAIATSSEAVEIMKMILKCVRRFMRMVQQAVFTDAFTTIFNHSLNILICPSDDEDILKLKIIVAKMIISLNGTYMRTEVKDSNERKEEFMRIIMSQFAVQYREQHLGNVFKAVGTCMGLPTNSILLAHIFTIFNQIVTYHPMVAREFVNPDFVNMMIRGCYLSETDLQDMDDNPDYYQQCNLVYEPGLDDTISPRVSSMAVLDNIVRKLGIRDDIFGILTQPPADPLDYEARFFLLGMLVKAGKKARKDMIESLPKNQRRVARRQLPPIGADIPDELVGSAIGALGGGEIPPFLQTTLLMFLATILKHKNPAAGVEVGLTMIQNGMTPMVVFAGCKLFKSCYDHLEDDSVISRERIPLCMPKILETATLFHIVGPLLDTINQICTMDSDSDSLQNYAGDLIQVLLNHAFEHTQRERSMGMESTEGASRVLCLIYDVIAKLDDDSEIMMAICDRFLEPIITLLKTFENDNENEEDLFDIIGGINQKLSIPRPVQIMATAALLEYVMAHEETLSIFPMRIACMFYPIIAAASRPIQEGAPQLVEPIVAMTNRMLQMNSDPDIIENGSEGLPYSMFLASCCIQAFGEATIPVFLPFVQGLLMELMTEYNTALAEGDEDPIESEPLRFVGCCYVLYAAMQINTPATLDAIGHVFIPFLIANLTPSVMSYGYREMQIAFAILLGLTSVGVNDAYLRASMNFQTLVRRKNIEEGEEEEEEEEEEDIDEYDGGNRFSVIKAPFKMAIDDFDAIQAYKQVSESSGLFASLPPELQQIITEAMPQ